MSRENVEVVRRIFEAFSRGDLEGGIVLADTPPEFEFVPSGALIPDLASVQRGPEAFRRVVETFTAEFDDPRVELHELIDAEIRCSPPSPCAAVASTVVSRRAGTR